MKLLMNKPCLRPGNGKAELAAEDSEPKALRTALPTQRPDRLLSGIFDTPTVCGRHEMSVARRLTSRVGVLYDGRATGASFDASWEVTLLDYNKPANWAALRRFCRGRGPSCWITSPAAREPRSPQSCRLRPVV